jgi:hypothetical protein
MERAVGASRGSSYNLSVRSCLKFAAAAAKIDNVNNLLLRSAVAQSRGSAS